MNYSSRCGRVLLCALWTFSVTGVVGRVPPALGGPPTGELQRHLLKYRSEIRSLSLKYYFRDAHGKGSQPTIYTWKVKGDSRLLRVEPPAAADPKSQLPNKLYLFDGKSGYTVHFWGHEPDRPKMVEKSSQIPERYLTEALPELVLGWRLPHTEDSLPTLLSRPEASVLADQVVSDVTCHYVNFGPCLRAGAPLNVVRGWLDPAQSFLPRRLSVMPYRLSKKLTDAGSAGVKSEPYHMGPGEVAQNIQIVDFTRVNDPFTGESKPFPQTIQLQMGNTITAHFADIQINPTIPDSEFIVSIPPGTQLVEKSAGQLDPQVQITGGEQGGAHWKTASAAELARSKQPANVLALDVQNSPLVNARLAPGNYIYLGSVFSFLLLLSVCSVVILRRALAVRHTKL